MGSGEKVEALMVRRWTAEAEVKAVAARRWTVTATAAASRQWRQGGGGCGNRDGVVGCEGDFWGIRYARSIEKWQNLPRPFRWLYFTAGDPPPARRLTPSRTELAIGMGGV